MHDEKSTGQKGSRIFPVQKNRKDRFSLLKEADRQIMLVMAVWKSAFPVSDDCQFLTISEENGADGRHHKWGRGSCLCEQSQRGKTE